MRDQKKTYLVADSISYTLRILNPRWTEINAHVLTVQTPYLNLTH